MIDIGAAAKGLSAVNDELDKLGLLEKVRNKLINDPDKAAKYLENVLSEIKQDIAVIDKEIVDLLSLSFKTEDERRATEKYFIEQHSNKMMERVEQNRGHCSKIYNIYLEFLRGWFSRVLDEDEADQLEKIFDEFRYFDWLVVDLMKKISSKIPYLEDELMRLMRENNVDKATRLIHSLRESLKEPRRRLYKNLSKLSELHADFIEITGTM